MARQLFTASGLASPTAAQFVASLNAVLATINDSLIIAWQVDLTEKLPAYVRQAQGVIEIEDGGAAMSAPFQVSVLEAQDAETLRALTATFYADHASDFVAPIVYKYTDQLPNVPTRYSAYFLWSTDATNGAANFRVGGSGGGSGGGSTFWQDPGAPRALANGATVDITAPAVPSNKLVLSALLLAVATGAYSADFGTSGDWLIGDATKQELAGGAIKLKDQGGGSSGAVVYGSATRVDATSCTATFNGIAGTVTTSIAEESSGWNCRNVLVGDNSGGAFTFFLGTPSAGVQGTVIIDMGAVINVTTLVVGIGLGAYGRPGNGVVTVSTDGVTYVPGDSYVTAGSLAGATDTLNINQQCRYIKFTIQPGGDFNTMMLYKVVINYADLVYPTGTWYAATTSDAGALDLAGVAQITSGAITGSNPASTSQRYLLSFDGRTTWEKWDGAAWVTHAGGVADIANGNTAAEIATGLSGYDVTAFPTLDLAIGQYTTDATATPATSAFDVDYEEEAHMSPVVVGKIDSAKADVGVTAIDSTTLRFKNQSGADGDFVFNMLYEA